MKKRIADWFTSKVVTWMFAPPRCKPSDRINTISGYDDDRCIFTGDHIITWRKNEHDIIGRPTSDHI